MYKEKLFTYIHNIIGKQYLICEEVKNGRIHIDIYVGKDIFEMVDSSINLLESRKSIYNDFKHLIENYKTIEILIKNLKTHKNV